MLMETITVYTFSDYLIKVLEYLEDINILQENRQNHIQTNVILNQKMLQWLVYINQQLKFCYKNITKYQEQQKYKIQKSMLLNNMQFKKEMNFIIVQQQQIHLQKKINGGEFVLKNDQIDQYLNSFSKFTYQYSQKYCIVSNMYANKDFIYEMIVSTSDGGFHELDYGEREVRNTLTNISNQPTSLGRFYNEQVEILASTK